MRLENAKKVFGEQFLQIDVPQSCCQLDDALPEVVPQLIGDFLVVGDEFAGGLNE